MSTEATINEDVKVPAWLKKRKRARGSNSAPKVTGVKKTGSLSESAPKVTAPQTMRARTVRPRNMGKPKKPFRLIAPRKATTKFIHARFTALEKPVQRSTHTQLMSSAREFAWLWLKQEHPDVYAQFVKLHGDPLSLSGVCATPPPANPRHRWN